MCIKHACIKKDTDNQKKPNKYIMQKKKIYVKNLNELSAITNIKKANQAFRSREGKK